MNTYLDFQCELTGLNIDDPIFDDVKKLRSYKDFIRKNKDNPNIESEKIKRLLQLKVSSVYKVLVKELPKKTKDNYILNIKFCTKIFTHIFGVQSTAKIFYYSEELLAALWRTRLSHLSAIEQHEVRKAFETRRVSTLSAAIRYVKRGQDSRIKHSRDREIWVKNYRLSTGKSYWQALLAWMKLFEPEKYKKVKERQYKLGREKYRRDNLDAILKKEKKTQWVEEYIKNHGVCRKYAYLKYHEYHNTPQHQSRIKRGERI